MTTNSAWGQDEEGTVVARYDERFARYGYDQRALGWGEKGRQGLRFEVLASHWSLRDRRVLDLGAGFGDFFSVAAERGASSYLGIDVTEALVMEGRSRFGHDPRFTLKLGSATDPTLYESCDVAIISGLFNFRLNSGRNREFITEVLGLAFQATTVGVACNFVTDRVDYREPLIHYQSPVEALGLGLALSKNCVLRQDYMPFEYSMFIDHNQTFDPAIAVFDHLVE